MFAVGCLEILLVVLVAVGQELILRSYRDLAQAMLRSLTRRPRKDLFAFANGVPGLELGDELAVLHLAPKVAEAAQETGRGFVPVRL